MTHKGKLCSTLETLPGIGSHRALVRKKTRQPCACFLYLTVICKYRAVGPWGREAAVSCQLPAVSKVPDVSTQPLAVSSEVLKLIADSCSLIG